MQTLCPSSLEEQDKRNGVARPRSPRTWGKGAPAALLAPRGCRAEHCGWQGCCSSPPSAAPGWSSTHGCPPNVSPP